MHRLSRLFALLLFSVLGIASCGSSNPVALSDAVSRQSTSWLWLEYSRNSSVLMISMIETELDMRGEISFGSRYIGQRTEAAIGRELYERGSDGLTTDVMNCADFTSSTAAQRFFLRAGGPVSDPHNLDGDGDGLACEWGTRIRSLASQARRAARPAYRAPSPTRSRCYTGPRGGTYTITSSGARDYNGC